MAYDRSLQRYRNWYAQLLRLYTSHYHERFAAEMEQTFSDILRERAGDGKTLFSCALWMFVETSASILNQQVIHNPMRTIHTRLAFVTASILMIPAVAMQFTHEVSWNLFDFVFAGVLIFGTGLLFELARARVHSGPYAIATGMALAGAFLLIWINGAVGIIGNEGNPANLMYFAVIAVGFLGALIARLKPQGMARALVATAVVQMLVPVVAFTLFHPPFDSGVVKVFILNACFVLLFIGSALLFRRAGTVASA